jgi:hypothetical protein
MEIIGFINISVFMWLLKERSSLNVLGKMVLTEYYEEDSKNDGPAEDWRNLREKSFLIYTFH